MFSPCTTTGVSKSQDMVMQLYSCLPKKLADLAAPTRKGPLPACCSRGTLRRPKVLQPSLFSVWEYNLLMVQFSRYIPFPLWMHNYSSFWISWVKLWGFASIGTRGAQKNSEKTLQVCKVTFWLGSLHALCDLEEEKVPFWLDWEWCRSLGWPHKVNSYQCLTQLCVSNIVGLSFLIITAHPVFFLSCLEFGSTSTIPCRYLC